MIFFIFILNEPKVAPVLDETPWQWFGAFKDDPTWGTLFDDIELKRNNQNNMLPLD